MVCHDDRMWEIQEHRRVEKQLSKLVPIEILRRIKGFRDEALTGQWFGYRSSRLSLKWRVIYQVIAKVLWIQVVEVTPHDYEKN